MGSAKKYGRVIWWDKRDLEGVIESSDGVELYFNSSSLGGETSVYDKIEPGVVVSFSLSTKITHTNYCTSAKILTPNAKKRIAKPLRLKLLDIEVEL